VQNLPKHEIMKIWIVLHRKSMAMPYAGIKATAYVEGNQVGIDVKVWFV